MFILHILQLQKWPYIYSFDLKELYIMSKWTHSEVNFLILSLYREIFTLTDRTKAMFTLLSCGQLLTGLIQIVSIEIDQQICRRSRGRGKQPSKQKQRIATLRSRANTCVTSKPIFKIIKKYQIILSTCMRNTQLSWRKQNSFYFKVSKTTVNAQ